MLQMVVILQMKVCVQCGVSVCVCVFSDLRMVIDGSIMEGSVSVHATSVDPCTRGQE